MKKYLLIMLSFFIVNFISAQNNYKKNIKDNANKSNVSNTTKPIIKNAVYHDISKPLSEMKPLKSNDYKAWKSGIVKNYFRTLPYNPFEVYDEDQVIQSKDGEVSSKSPLINFEGINNTYGVAPPDPTGDVGPNHYFQMVNNGSAIYNKSGVKLWGPQNSSVFWDGFEGPWTGTNDGDPIVLYDQVADRWVVSQFAVNTVDDTQWELIAVSASGDPLGEYYRYAFEFTDMPDYPKFGIWPDGYYMSANRFTVPAGDFNGTYACSFERDAMLTGGNARMILFEFELYFGTYSMLPSDCDGEFPELGTPNYFCYDEDDDTYGSLDRLVMYAFHSDWENTDNSYFRPLTWFAPTAFNSNFPLDLAQPGTSVRLDLLNDRMMFRNQYRKFDDHESIVLNRVVNTGNNEAGIRWYELRKTDGDWTVFQESTYKPDNVNRWMGSIAMNGFGDIALGYSAVSTTIYPSIRYTGRRDSDPLNIMSIEEGSIFAGRSSQTGPTRWGDYSTMSVDPTDDYSFWYTTEYSIGGWNWRTKIAKFSFSDTEDIRNFTAKALSDSEIELNWNYNENNDAVLVAWSADGVFGQPVDGGTYNAGYEITGGGTVLNFLNNPNSLTHLGLTGNTKYYYKIWSYLPDKTYTSGVVISKTTLSGAPNNFMAVADSKYQIKLSWNLLNANDDIVLAYSENETFGELIDGNVYTPGDDILGGGKVILVENNSIYYHSSLTPNKKYYYKIWTKSTENNYTTGNLANASTDADILFYDGFETNTGWTLDGEWEIDAPLGLGGSGGYPDPTSAFEGTKILGLDLTGLGTNLGDYETNDNTPDFAVSPSINCSEYSNVKLKFERWLGFETLEFDTTYIEISADGGEWQKIWTNPLFTYAESIWSKNEIDIATYADGKSDIKIRFVMASSDEGLELCGWNIDNLEVVGTKTITTNDVTFNIKDNSTSNPIQGAKIEVNGNTLLTDASGNAVVKLENGTFSYTVSAFGYEDKSSSVTVSGITSKDETLVPLATYTANFNVKETGSLNNLSGAMITLNGENLITDASGNVIKVLPIGTYNYSVSADGYVAKTNLSFTITASDVNVDNLLDVLPTYNVNFTVSDGNLSSPIQGATLTIDGNDYLTDASGIYSLPLHDGEYSYIVSYTNFGTVEGFVTVNGASQDVSVSIYPATNTVTANVYQIDGTTPIEGANVTFNGVQGTTDASGVATFSQIAKGLYYWSVNATGYYSEIGSSNVLDADLSFNILMNLEGSGIKEVSNSDINIFPNPNKGTFTVSFEKVVGSAFISVVDVTGKEVYKTIVKNVKEKEINIGSANKGIYFIKINNEGKVITSKFVVN